MLIVGSGPAGALLAAQLSSFPGISTRLVERRDGPLQVGQADGIACRTVEMFEAFGLGQKLIREAYWVNETVFWRPSQQDRARIERTGRIQDTEDGLSEFPHVIVNQARLQQYLLDYMRRSPTRLEADYGLEFVTLKVEAEGEHPVVVTLRDVASGSRDHRCAPSTSSAATARAAGCAMRSAPCRSGDFANHAWGVVDMLAVTDFPDIRAQGRHPVRPTRATSCSSRARAATWCACTSTSARSTRTSATPSATSPQEEVIATAQRVLHPYTLDVKNVVWFAVYEVGQRVTDRFDDVPAEQVGTRLPRVFIAGDACHTHSAKAGQGMNVSMQDALQPRLEARRACSRAAPGRNCCAPTPPSARRSPRGSSTSTRNGRRSWRRHRRIRAARNSAASIRRASGVLREVGSLHGRCRDALRADDGTDRRGQATRPRQGFTIGMRFHSAPVVRLADAKPVQLGHVARADGAWRIYAFADASGQRLRELAAFLAESPNSPIRRFTPTGADIDSVIDVRAIFQQGHRDLKVRRAAVHSAAAQGLLRSHRLREGLLPRPQERRRHLRSARHRPRARVRWSSCVPTSTSRTCLPLDAHDELAAFFGRFLIDRH